MSPSSAFSALERARLLQIDEGLRKQADVFLDESGLGSILTSTGFVHVGSYSMGTMTWRDLDFERVSENSSWAEHWELGRALAETGWGWRFNCLDEYRNPEEPGEHGFYWGVRASSPGGGPTWKLDIWTARAHEFGIAGRERWMAALNEETRLHILAIKEAVCTDPRYRRALLSVHIYEAVLDEGVRGIEGFRRWWDDRYGRG